MAFLAKRAFLMAAPETTVGTDIIGTDVSANWTIEVFDLTFTPEAETAERDTLTGQLGRGNPEVAGIQGSISFSCYNKGSGSVGVAPAHGVLLKGCAMTETIVSATSVTYAPSSNPATSLSIAYRVGSAGGAATGQIFKLVGCQGTPTFDYSRGANAIIQFEFRGQFVQTVDENFPSVPAFETTDPLPVRSATYSEGLGDAVIAGFTMALNNDITMRPDIQQVSSFKAAAVVARNVGGTLTVEAELLATTDRWTAWLSGTTTALSLALGSTAGNKVTHTIARAQYVTMPVDNTDNILTHAIDYSAGATLDTQNDECAIEYT